MSRVDIGRTVDYQTLETALVKAAEELGWKAQFEDEFDQNYRLGSVQEVKEYTATTVFLKGFLGIPEMQVRIYGKESVNSFYVGAGPFGIASERKVKEYLSAVSKHL